MSRAIPLTLLDQETLQRVSEITLSHYNQNAESFWEGTRSHDVSQNIAALLDSIQSKPPFRILDFGCGPGRDLRTFRTLGHHVTGLEGACRLAEMARAYSGCEVWEQDFLRLRIPSGEFDGIFANASLFHVPGQALARVLGQLRKSLKPGGVLLSSNPHGDNQEGWFQQRYGAYHDLDTWRRHLRTAGFEELKHYYRPSGLPRARQAWLVTLWRRTGAD